jgi:hypothetical protein
MRDLKCESNTFTMKAQKWRRGIALDWMVKATPLKPGTHFVGRWVRTTAGLDGCETSRPYRVSVPGPSNP